ncbi:Vitamin B12 import ATP-binding protein BtuD [Mesoplasma sp. JKS002658]|uniref:energy-coupling factor transporter ATPase n=1 Tax=Mesoplasma whartonense TaxID=2878854 RepID=UPI002022AA62|nr:MULTISPECIES: energy-coupling factor transporter ATPase [unclassified Mesoplasma]MCL8211361.1 Vitamin B12 import ATP-binding protein BtuD [Mesoplasma sp. JKS002664]MCL8212214.1 Vitamin B12 import ATP-binding protein BtuD [Mesoplasma sp. JKS002662]MCL8214257.1 Vitamin B12 import ATP-binding protein BtuD [Mesoplasma sp. JKS002658]MCL8214699.1 Vitamin B12 import ATP-binding protein BtuD [Mesoplasma sp. JKS002663]MCL8215577.1 Vitamin B12 import ATP-binding protein BtuD [Mesoplasma sp. JKS002659
MEKNQDFSTYLTEKLNQSDLDAYSQKLNSLNQDVNNSLEVFLSAKKKYHHQLITRIEYQQAKTNYHQAKANYQELIKIKAFKNNLVNINSLVKSTSVSDPSYETIINEQKAAQKLYAEFKEVVKSQGRLGNLEKLSPVAIEIKDLAFRYDEDEPLVLDDINLKINHGEYVAIVGHNGSGKSTLSKLLIGVLQPDEGSIKIFGNLMQDNNVEKVRQFVGIVFQNPDNQFIGSTVQDDIAFGLENHRVDPALMPTIIQASATRVGMENFLDKEPLMLSGGQKQRVAIASTLALDSDIIIFDEATSMLDPKGRREIKEIMVDLKNEGQKTILSITHDMDEILNASKVMVLNQGKMVRFGDPATVMGDKEFLRGIGLELPFVSMVEDALNNKGIKVQEGAKNLAELVDHLCALK